MCLKEYRRTMRVYQLPNSLNLRGCFNETKSVLKNMGDGASCRYEPEISPPGILIRFKSFSFWVFSSGKIVANGNAQKKSQEKIISFLWKYAFKENSFEKNGF